MRNLFNDLLYRENSGCLIPLIRLNKVEEGLNIVNKHPPIYLKSSLDYYDT